MKRVNCILFFCLIAVTAKAQTFAVTALRSPAGSGSAEPFLFAAKSGLLLSWLEPVATTDRVALRVARLNGTTWSESHTIVERDDLFVNWADFPSVVEDANGILYAQWLQKSGKSAYGYDVKIAIASDDGRTWKPPFTLNRDRKKSEHGFASLAPLPRGGVGVTWLDGRRMVEGKEEGEMTLRYATVDARGRIDGDVELDRRTCQCCTTGMTIAANGPVIVYRDRSEREIRDIASMRQTASGWTAPQLVHADGWKIGGCPVNGPQIDSLNNRVVSAWFTAANEQPRVYVAFSKDGGRTFAEPIRVDDGKPAGRVDVVLINDDAAVVTWLEQTRNGTELRARSVGSSPSHSVKIADASSARAAGFPRIARIGEDVFVAWTEQTLQGKHVRVARLRF